MVDRIDLAGRRCAAPNGIGFSSRHAGHRRPKRSRRRSAGVSSGWLGDCAARAKPPGAEDPRAGNSGAMIEDVVSECHGCANCGGTAVAEPPPLEQAATRTAVALVGPPNSGKTTLFNRLTGLRQKVANFPGVTVEQHSGIAELPDGRAVRIIDLPGVVQPFAAIGRRADRLRRADRATVRGVAKPQAILLVLDSTNLGRQLMLAAPILSLGSAHAGDFEPGRRPAAERRQAWMRTRFRRSLGAPVALVSARSGDGIVAGARFSGRRHAASRCRVRIAGIAGRPGMPQMGWSDGRQSGLPRAGANRNGRGGWIRYFCIRCSGRWCFWRWCVAVFQVIFSVAAPLPDL